MPAWARFCGQCGTELATDDDGMVGRILADRYRIIRRLATGTMSTVYVAEQQIGEASRFVAIKMLPPELADDDLRGRFYRECELVVALHHPNTIRFFDFGELRDGTLFIVMEYVEGETLRTVLSRGPLPFERARQIVAQIVGSLGEAHARGIVHRDLKPENVLVAPHGHTRDFAKVVDFGIAKSSRPAFGGAAQLTVPGTLLGTPAYMSPEQFTGGEVDSRTDVYALGVMTYEMLAGVPPFTGETPMDWATQHLHAEPRKIREVAAGSHLPAYVERALAHALAKNRAHRPSTVEEFFEELVGTREALVSSRRFRLADVADESLSDYRLPKRSPLGPALAAALIVALATAAGYLTWAWGTERGPFVADGPTAVSSSEGPAKP